MHNHIEFQGETTPDGARGRAWHAPSLLPVSVWPRRVCAMATADRCS